MTGRAPRTVRVVAALIPQPGDGSRFLVQQRLPGGSRALLWEFPGGKVEAGETDEAALARECREELDVVLEVGRRLWEGRHTYPDLTVELVDASGGTARVPLSQFGKPRKPLEITVYRRKGRDKTAFPNTYEMVLQTYVMPFREFTRGPSGFDASRVRTIRLVFDRTAVGQVVVDDIGFSAIDPAYLAQRN